MYSVCHEIISLFVMHKFRGFISGQLNFYLVLSSYFSLQEHPRKLIPELCKQFYHLGWVTGTGGGISIKLKWVSTIGILIEIGKLCSLWPDSMWRAFSGRKTNCSKTNCLFVNSYNIFIKTAKTYSTNTNWLVGKKSSKFRLWLCFTIHFKGKHHCDVFVVCLRPFFTFHKIINLSTQCHSCVCTQPCICIAHTTLSVAETEWNIIEFPCCAWTHQLPFPEVHSHSLWSTSKAMLCCDKKPKTTQNDVHQWRVRYFIEQGYIDTKPYYECIFVFVGEFVHSQFNLLWYWNEIIQCSHFFLLHSINSSDEIYIAPSGVQKERILPEDLFVQNLEGDDLQEPPEYKK